MNLLTPAQAAKRLGCSRAYIYKLVAHRKLERYFVGLNGGTLRVSDEDIDRFIAEAKAPIKGDAA